MAGTSKHNMRAHRIKMNGSSEEGSSYLPFRGLSAWFSSSVKPFIAKKWDQFGGCLANEEDADYLFSDNSYSVDTVRVYDTQPGVVVFQSAWINRVLTEHCTVYDIPLGQYLVLPHFLVQVCMTGDPFKTPEPSALLEQHRRGATGGSPTAPGHAGSVTDLSQLLARREKRKSAGSRRRKMKRDPQLCREGEQLRNSRAYYSSDRVGERGREESCKEEVKCGSGEAVCSTETVVQREGVRGAVWDTLLHCMKTTSLKDFQHIDDIEVVNHDLVDFEPCLPHFTMQRM